MASDRIRLMPPRAGDHFTHKHRLDLSAPVRERQHAVCRVTSVRRGLVYYTYADAPVGAKGAFTMTVESWEDDYGGM